VTEQEQQDLMTGQPDEAEATTEPMAFMEPIEREEEGDDAAANPAPSFVPSPVDEPPAPLAQKIIPFLLAGSLLAADQLSKQWIIANVPDYESMTPIPALEGILRFTHIHNTGAAFGMFPTGSLFFTAIAIIVAIAIVVYTRRLGAGHYLLRLALGLQLGGALGNLTDRLQLGYVTDFIDVTPFPFIFNIADASIVGGVAVLFYLMLLESLEERRQKRVHERPPVNTEQSSVASYQLPASNEPLPPEVSTHPLPHSSSHSLADSESL